MSRVYCGQCCQETLHLRGSCIHCQASHVIVIRPHPRLTKPAMPRPYKVPFRGEMLSLKQIAKLVGLAYSTVTERYRAGLRDNDLVEAIAPDRSRPKGPKVAA